MADESSFREFLGNFNRHFSRIRVYKTPAGHLYAII